MPQDRPGYRSTRPHARSRYSRVTCRCWNFRWRWDVTPIGPKREQGDGKTPEGRYFILSRLRNSRFHRALQVSYPSLSDQMLADARGVPPGGRIMIHGVGPNERAEQLHPLFDWTDGCIAVTDEQIEALWARVPVGTPVDILP